MGSTASAKEMNRYMKTISTPCVSLWNTVFKNNLKVSIVFELSFEQIPQQFRNYIITRASRKFANRYLGSQEIEGFTLRDEVIAKALAVDSDSENADRTIFDNYDIKRVIDR